MRYSLLVTSTFAALSAAVTFAAENAHHWSYSGETGPSHWGALEHDYGACGTGKTQSPIDIRSHDARQEPLPALQFDYKPTPLHIVNNGHTIQVNVGPGSALIVGGARYELVQFHFHHPSEEQIDGKSFDMVAHLVHRNAKGQLAVVAVPIRSGSRNALLATLSTHFPHQAGLEAAVQGVTIDPAGLLPREHGYYAFGGSLTTPPCTEGVRWMVLKSAATASSAEIATFAVLYPHNARPVQPLNGRRILASQ